MLVGAVGPVSKNTEELLVFAALTVIAVLPEFVSVNDCAALVVPTGT